MKVRIIPFIFILFNTIINGYVLSVLWGWFIKPLFNAPGLSIPAAIGLIMIVELFKSVTNYANDDGLAISDIVIIVEFLDMLKAILILVIGYIVSLYI